MDKERERKTEVLLPPTPFFKSGKRQISKQVCKFLVTWEEGGEILTLGEELENLPSGVT